MCPQELPPLSQDEFNRYPDSRGHFGRYGGRFVAETLISALDELEALYHRFRDDTDFLQELEQDLQHYAGRPSPLYFAKNLTALTGGANIYFKREDLNHTGSHKINNCIGQGLLAKRSGKRRLIAETGAGQHGVATATVAARLGMEAVIYMGAEDMRRQAMNLYRMRLLGAEVVAVTAGSKTLKDALNEALRDWVTHVETTFYIIGSVTGPAPYPELVRNFQTVIGRELQQQSLRQIGKLPDALVACVGGGSNAIGLFHPFLGFPEVKLFGVEAAGLGIASGKHSAPLSDGLSSAGVLHGNRTYVRADEQGQILEAHSISAGLDYPGVGPEHSWLKDIGRVSYVHVDDNEALEGFRAASTVEGIIPALESAHAIAYALKLAKQLGAGANIVVNLSGRGDKDLATVAAIDGIQVES